MVDRLPRRWWLSVAAAAQTLAESSARRGEQLFVGQEPLKGAIVGHDDALPVFASKCVNCHEPAASEQANYGSKLTPAALLEAAARRGGPPSRYEARSFCRLPAHRDRSDAHPQYCGRCRVTRSMTHNASHYGTI